MEPTFRQCGGANPVDLCGQVWFAGQQSRYRTDSIQLKSKVNIFVANYLFIFNFFLKIELIFSFLPQIIKLKCMSFLDLFILLKLKTFC